MNIFDLHAAPKRSVSLALSSALFLIAIALYAWTAHTRHLENPDDNVVPTFTQIVDGIDRAALEPDRKGNYRLWVDTVASAKRFGISLAFLILAVVLGLHMGIYPYFYSIFHRFMLFFDKIPALALLPILFIVFGLGEVSKIALILLGVFPTIALDTCLRARGVPREQIIKGLSLGATHWEVTYKIVLPQIMPAVLDTIRLNFKAMILFLIAGESLAASVGLGYRIFVLRRYIAMDIIIPYVLWMSLLALAADWLVRLWIRKRYSWSLSEGGRK